MDSLNKGHKLAKVNRLTSSSKVKQEYNPLLEGVFDIVENPPQTINLSEKLRLGIEKKKKQLEDVYASNPELTMNSPYRQKSMFANSISRD